MASLPEMTLNLKVKGDLVKPGYKTTEFWLTALVHLLTLLIASGIFKPGSPWAAVAALVMSTLAQLQYNSGRTTVKTETINAPAPTPTPAQNTGGATPPGNS